MERFEGGQKGDRARRRGSRCLEEGDLATGKSIAAERGAWVVFEDEAGQSTTPPRARTWGRIASPVVRMRGRGSGRVTMAGMTCYKAGEGSRLIYAIREYRVRKDEPRGFGWRDFRKLIVRAHTQLGGPIVLVWDNVRLHLTAGTREFIAVSAAPPRATNPHPPGHVADLVGRFPRVPRRHETPAGQVLCGGEFEERRDPLDVLVRLESGEELLNELDAAWRPDLACQQE
ncbi:hypothetical protein ABZ890_41995 [Streptomyces sp. NPDC046984]|uniref:hypothetical protein n=1 Tax=Streptomyces sp. NPDC046984 TaxID=3155138 RepID=UPI00340C3795